MSDSVKEKNLEYTSIRFGETVLVEKVRRLYSMHIQGRSPIFGEEEIDLSKIMNDIPPMIVLYSRSSTEWITIFTRPNLYVHRSMTRNPQILWETDEHRVERVLREILG